MKYMVLYGTFCPKRGKLQYYSVSKAAKMCGMNRKTIIREIKKGHLPAVQRLGRYWIEETDLKNWDERNYNSDLKNAVLAPGQSDPNKLSSHQPDKNKSQTEIQPNSSNTTIEEPGKPAGGGQEKEGATETRKNAEEYLKYWNSYSPVKYLTPDGHLPESTINMVERFMSENNIDLKHGILTIRIFFYLFDNNLLKINRAGITLKEYFKREYYLIFAFPKLTPEEEKELDTALESHEIHCYHCNELTHGDGPLIERKCPKCGMSDEIEIREQAIEESTMKKYPVLKLFYDKYYVYLKRSQAKIRAWEQKEKQEWYREVKENMYQAYAKDEDRNKIMDKVKDRIKDKDEDKLDWSIIADMNSFKREIYDEEYAQEIRKHKLAELAD
jgi:phage FluMu protein Com